MSCLVQGSGSTDYPTGRILQLSSPNPFNQSEFILDPGGGASIGRERESIEDMLGLSKIVMGVLDELRRGGGGGEEMRGRGRG